MTAAAEAPAEGDATGEGVCRSLHGQGGVRGSLSVRCAGRKQHVGRAKSKTNVFIGLGIVINVVGGIIARGMPLIGWLIAAAGSVLFIMGCCFYAKGKGYHGAVGLLGLLSCLGLIVLVVLPDKFK